MKRPDPGTAVAWTAAHAVIVAAAVALLLVEPIGAWAAGGSTINTASEVERLRFKRRPENTGRLYTGGLFSWSMHVNYFGDILWCVGMALIAGRGIALIIPALMTAMFVWIHIPRLDAHLAGKYGEQFDRYRRTTSKLIPGVY